jgi:DNA-binding response OmpR family regulator
MTGENTMQENLSLREQLEEAQEENRQLRELFLPTTDFPLAWRLSKTERRLLGALYAYTAGAPLSKEALHRAVSRDHVETHPKIVDVFICKARKKLIPLGIVIETVWGRGYCLTPDSRQIIREALTPQLQQVA